MWASLYPIFSERSNFCQGFGAVVDEDGIDPEYNFTSLSAVAFLRLH